MKIKFSGFAMDRYAYYVCFKCKKAYFGGEARFAIYRSSLDIWPRITLLAFNSKGGRGGENEENDTEAFGVTNPAPQYKDIDSFFCNYVWTLCKEEKMS